MISTLQRLLIWGVCDKIYHHKQSETGLAACYGGAFPAIGRYCFVEARAEMFGIVRFEHLWMVSRVARRRFMILSACSLVLGILVVLMTYQPKLFDGRQQPLAVRIVELIVVCPAIVGCLCMFFAMAWYCLMLDTSNAFLRVLLAFLMLCTFPLGQVVYYFLVYHPQTARVAMKIIWEFRLLRSPAQRDWTVHGMTQRGAGALRFLVCGFQLEIPARLAIGIVNQHHAVLVLQSHGLFFDYFGVLADEARAEHIND
jgi:hypothetical protein